MFAALVDCGSRIEILVMVTEIQDNAFYHPHELS